MTIKEIRRRIINLDDIIRLNIGVQGYKIHTDAFIAARKAERKGLYKRLFNLIG